MRFNRKIRSQTRKIDTYVKENNMIYYNCSAKSDINVHEGFSKLAHKIKKNVENNKLTGIEKIFCMI